MDNIGIIVDRLIKLFVEMAIVMFLALGGTFAAGENEADFFTVNKEWFFESFDNEV